MAKITAGVGSSHVPLLGVAVDQGKWQDDYFGPIFAGYDSDRIRQISQTVFDLFEEEDGLDALFGLIRDALPERLNETAYALACDVAAADGNSFSTTTSTITPRWVAASTSTLSRPTPARAITLAMRSPSNSLILTRHP